MPKESKNKKENKHFFKDFKAELKKVIWPTPKQLVNNTVAVATIVLITAAIVFVLDTVFDLGNIYGITKLQSIVDEKFNSEEDHDHDHNHEHEEEKESEDANSTNENATEGETITEGNTTTENTESPVENAEQ